MPKERGYTGIVGRNVKDVETQFAEDPSKILVSVQLEKEQIEHLGSGLGKRHRRLIPLTTLAKMLFDLRDKSKQQ